MEQECKRGGLGDGAGVQQLRGRDSKSLGLRRKCQGSAAIWLFGLDLGSLHAATLLGQPL